MSWKLMIIRYKYKNDFIAAFGNSYLYKKEGKIDWKTT